MRCIHNRFPIRFILIGSLLWGLLPLSSSSLVKAATIGKEFQINTYAEGPQSSSVLAMDSLGNFVVAWLSRGQDGSAGGIYARRYSADGEPLTPEFRVNTTTLGEQNLPAIAMDHNGNFTITWMDSMQDGSLAGVYAQRYDASANPLGGEFRVNSTTYYMQYQPSIDYDGQGNFVISWTNISFNSQVADIYGQRFNPSGEMVDGEFQVNTYVEQNQSEPDIAVRDDGSFIIVWESADQDGSGLGLYAQAFDPNGLPVGSEFRVNTHTANDQQDPAVAVDAVGNVVVVWSSKHDGDFDIYAQRYDPQLKPVGEEFVVNSGQVGEQSYPAISVVGSGDFLITWSGDSQTDYGIDVYGQRFHQGAFYGKEFQINLYTSNNQEYPDVAALSLESFTVVWHSYLQDGSSAGVFGRVFALPAPLIVNTIEYPGDGICDSIECTWQEAVMAANTLPGPQMVAFDIPGSGPHLIHGAVTITDALFVDGYSQLGTQPNRQLVDQGLNAQLQIVLADTVTVTANDSTVRGIVFSDGLTVAGHNMIIEGNFFGTDADGMSGGTGNLVITGRDTRVGALIASGRNLIAGDVSVRDFGSATFYGNLIGTDVTGTRSLGSGKVAAQNGYVGIGRDDPQARNVLVAVELDATSSSVTNNYIGVDVSGAQPLGSGGRVVVGDTARLILSDNLIAYGESTAVVIQNQAQLSGNRIFANRALGIDVHGDGLSLNDPGDANNIGAKAIQNFPIINRAYTAGGMIFLEGILDTKPRVEYTLEFFANSECDPSGFGEGERILGTARVTPDLAGKATFAVHFPMAVPIGDYVTALGTNFRAGNTSEFSPCRAVGATLVNEMFTMNGYSTAYDPMPVTYAPAGVYTIAASFTNHSSSTLRELYYRVSTLGGNNLLLNAQGGPVGTGGVVTVPGQITPGATITVDFVIGLQQQYPFDFYIDAFGLTDDVGAAIQENLQQLAFDFTIEDEALQSNEGESATGTHSYYLPFVSR